MDAEIWWDSLPLVYRNWAKAVAKGAPTEKKEMWQAQLNRLFDPDHLGETLFRGVTTNPPLSLDAIKDKLKRLPFFVMSYEPDGMTKEKFNRHGALVGIAAEFFMATRAMVDFVAQQFEPGGKMQETR